MMDAFDKSWKERKLMTYKFYYFGQRKVDIHFANPHWIIISSMLTKL